MAPRRITDREELWAGPRNHSSRIGNFFVKLYETQPTVSDRRAPPFDSLAPTGYTVSGSVQRIHEGA